MVSAAVTLDESRRSHNGSFEWFGGLEARESVGPDRQVRSLGAVLTIHDSRFEPHRGIGHHPHQGMERLFYVLSGTVDHDDALNGITGHMGTGDLGILTEGRRGMIHSEENRSDGTARVYIFVYPNEPLNPSASFDAVRDADTPRECPGDGVETKRVLTRGDDRINGDFRELSDTTLQPGAALSWQVGSGEAGVVFVVDGSVVVELSGDHAREAAADHTLLLPPREVGRGLAITARERSCVLTAVAGPGGGTAG